MKKTLKKAGCIVLSCMMLAGCTQGATAGQTDTGTTQPQTESTQTEADAGQTGSTASSGDTGSTVTTVMEKPPYEGVTAYLASYPGAGSCEDMDAQAFTESEEYWK